MSSGRILETRFTFGLQGSDVGASPKKACLFLLGLCFFCFLYMEVSMNVIPENLVASNEKVSCRLFFISF